MDQNVNQHNLLQQALTLSEQILTAIDEQNLAEVTRLDIDRRLVIDRYYKNNNAVDDSLTRELKRKNDQIVSQLKNMQQQISAQQINLKQSQKVSRAYLENV